MLDEVEIMPVLHKVTGAGHGCKGGGDLGVWTWGGGGGVVSEFSVAWGKRGEGGQEIAQSTNITDTFISKIASTGY